MSLVHSNFSQAVNLAKHDLSVKYQAATASCWSGQGHKVVTDNSSWKCLTKGIHISDKTIVPYKDPILMFVDKHTKRQTGRQTEGHP